MAEPLSLSGKSRDRIPTPEEQNLELALHCPWLDPGERGEKLEIHDFPTFMILRLATVTKNSLARRYLDPFGITIPEWRLLALLARFGTRLFSEVTAGSSMDKGQVSRTLKSLDKKGLLKLNSLHAADRPRSSAISPRIQVTISPKGRALFNRILPVARAYQCHLIEMLSPEERTVFHRVALRLLNQAPDLREHDP